jgi:hypothetical protein
MEARIEKNHEDSNVIRSRNVSMDGIPLSQVFRERGHPMDLKVGRGLTDLSSAWFHVKSA